MEIKTYQSHSARARVKTKARAHGLIIPSPQEHRSTTQTNHAVLFFHWMLLVATERGLPHPHGHFILFRFYFVPPVAGTWLGSGDPRWARPPVCALREPAVQPRRLLVRLPRPPEAALAHRSLSLSFQVLVGCLRLMVLSAQNLIIWTSHPAGEGEPSKSYRYSLPRTRNCSHWNLCVCLWVVTHLSFGSWPPPRFLLILFLKEQNWKGTLDPGDE